MEIRRLAAEDIDSVVILVGLNYDTIMSQVHSTEIVEKFKSHNKADEWKRQMSWKDIFVVEDGTEIIATGALVNFGSPDVPRYCVSNFFVAPSMQNKGVGKLLLRAILGTAKNKGIDIIHVPSSRSGYEFYKKAGFVKDDIQTDVEDEITWMSMKLDT